MTKNTNVPHYDLSSLIVEGEDWELELEENKFKQKGRKVLSSFFTSVKKSPFKEIAWSEMSKYSCEVLLHKKRIGDTNSLLKASDGNTEVKDVDETASAFVEGYKHDMNTLYDIPSKHTSEDDNLQNEWATE